MTNQCVVTVIKSYGDTPCSDTIINGVVSAEIKRIRDERDFAEWRVQNCHKKQRIESTFSYDVQPSRGLQRVAEQFIGLVMLLNEERRLNRAVRR